MILENKENSSGLKAVGSGFLIRSIHTHRHRHIYTPLGQLFLESSNYATWHDRSRNVLIELGSIVILLRDLTSGCLHSEPGTFRVFEDEAEPDPRVPSVPPGA